MIEAGEQGARPGQTEVYAEPTARFERGERFGIAELGSGFNPW